MIKAAALERKRKMKDVPLIREKPTLRLGGPIANEVISVMDK